MAGDLQPLDQKFPIVDQSGKPTLYFIEWAQQKQIDIQGSITAEQFNILLLEYLLAHQLQEGDGIALTPSGNISDSPEISVRNGTGLNFDGMGNIKIADTEVTPGTYGDATNVGQFTVDQQGRITAAANVAISGGGGGGGYTAHNVATAGDAFIDVSVSGGGGVYELFIVGENSTDAIWNFRVSNDNGATFLSGASDYKTGATNGNAVALSATSGVSRAIQGRYTLAGMNSFYPLSANRFSIQGTRYGVVSAGTPSSAVHGGGSNASTGPYDAFRFFVSAGDADDITVYVKELI